MFQSRAWLRYYSFFSHKIFVWSITSSSICTSHITPWLLLGIERTEEKKRTQCILSWPMFWFTRGLKPDGLFYTAHASLSATVTFLSEIQVVIHPNLGWTLSSNKLGLWVAVELKRSCLRVWLSSIYSQNRKSSNKIKNEKKYFKK